MKEFFLAALPFVLAGLAVAILCAGRGGKTEQENGKAQENRLAAGMLMGLAIGVALDACGVLENPMIGLTLGPLWGMALASLEKKPARKKAGEEQKTGGHLSCNTEKKSS